jgi:adenosylhomocysteine nucleosidase
MASLDVLLVMALKEESQGLFEAQKINPFYCGIGQVKATFHLSQWIKEYNPKWVINLGSAGSQKLNPGELVECTSFIQRSPQAELQIPSKILQTKPLTKLQPAVCGTADFVEQGAPITSCDVFDMEAYALAYVCQNTNVKFSCIKAISDRSDKNVIQDWKLNLKTNASLLLSFYREMTTL